MSDRRVERLAGEEGAVLVAGLLLSLALLMVIGAATDIGRAFIVHRQLVSVADDAALTGSQALDPAAVHAGQLRLDPAQAQTAALQSVAAEPQLHADVSATAAAVHVRVTQRIPTVLLRLAGISTLTVAADATAAPRAP
jgi:Flp pilus assembly protein TadG